MLAKNGSLWLMILVENMIWRDHNLKYSLYSATEGTNFERERIWRGVGLRQSLAKSLPRSSSRLRSFKQMYDTTTKKVNHTV